MAPEGGCAAALRAAAENCLRWEQTESAVFLAERLCAEEPGERNLHLLALCNVRAGQTARA